MSSEKSMEHKEIREHLTGPNPSVQTPFNKDGSVDFDGIRNNIDFVLEAGARSILLTVGDSHYFCLSDEEIAEITRVTCEHVGKRAMVIAGDRNHSTARAITFAKYAKGLGVDLYNSVPPDWAGSCTPQTLAEHYCEIAKVMPVMILTGQFIPRGSDFILEAIELAINQSRNIVAIKDDMCGDFGRRLSLLAYERCAIFSGGMKVNHMNALPYGCDGYLSSFISIKPEIAHRYWDACEKLDFVTARQIIRDYDIPFFDFIGKLPGGFDAGVHGTFELFGIAKRWRRKPYHSLTDEEMERLADFFKKLSLL